MTDQFDFFGAWGKNLMSIDLTKGTDELFRFMAGFKVPGVDMDALIATQRDNLEALNAANQAALKGFQEASQWQMKVLQESMREMTTAMNKLAKVTTPQQLIAAETDLARKTFEAAIRQMRELAEIVNSANEQATNAIARRIPESLDEIKDALKATM
jgi:phasin family protein